MPFKFENRVSPTVHRRVIADVFSYAWTIAEDQSCFSAVYEFGTAFTAMGLCVISANDAEVGDDDWHDALGARITDNKNEKYSDR